MDTDDESTAYLKYLNDPTSTTNNYLLSNSVELTDSFPFSEIGTTDWPSESFPVLLSTSLITDCNNADEVENINIQLFNQQGISVQSDRNQEIVLQEAEDSIVNEIQNGSEIVNSHNIKDNVTCTLTAETTETYINFSPIVKENANGNKEIYLTENDINNDASIIQLLNTDGSVITIDKSILSTLNLSPHQDGNSSKPKYNYEEYISAVIAYKCKVCKFLCESDGEIKKHLNEKHAQLFIQDSSIVRKTNCQTSLLKSNNEAEKKYTIYLCSLCKLAFSDKIQLKEHMVNKHNLTTSINEIKVNEERISKPKENERGSLRTLSTFLIKQQEKARKKVKCTIKGCHVRFAREELREKHEQCHIDGNKSQFQCAECEETFSIWRICSNHMWKHHKIDIGLLSCSMCNAFKSNSSIRLLNHMAIHDDEKPFLCSECGKGFKTLAQVKNHEVLHKKPSDVPNWFMTKQCETCQRYFANSKSLKKHIQSVHENFKPFICNICGHKTARKAMLELHLRQHTGDKPHKCPYCEYRAGDHNCLRKHVMKHMGLRKYKCSYCTYTSIQSSSYKNHIKNRHPGKSGTYSCTYCSFTCINFVNFSAHIKRHEAVLNEKVIGIQPNEINSPKNDCNPVVDAEDDETQNCIFSKDIIVEETVDTGGITIPAGLEI